MELPSNLIQQKIFNTKPNFKKHMLNNLDKSIHEHHLSQLIQTINEQFKIALTFLTGYNAIFIFTNKINNFCFTKSINDDSFSLISIPKGAYEIVPLYLEIQRSFIEAEYFTGEYYLF